MNRSALPRDLLEATVTGALTLVDPHRLSPRRRTAYRLAVAALSGFVADRAVREGGEDFDAFEQANIAPAVGFGAAGLVFGSMPLWERTDLATHRWLERRGVKHPRRVLAALAVVGTLGAALTAGPKQGSDPVEDVAPHEEPLDHRLRDVLRAILGATEEYAAPSLRRQLADAVVEVWGDPDDSADSPVPEFVELRLRQPEAHERVIPRSFTFPVRARTRAGHEIQVAVHDGHLAHVLLDWADGHPVGDEDWPAEWPTLDEIRLVHDHEIG